VEIGPEVRFAREWFLSAPLPVNYFARSSKREVGDDRRSGQIFHLQWV
jgi:hypothetical protein